jgi:antitoxin YefM
VSEKDRQKSRWRPRLASPLTALDTSVKYKYLYVVTKTVHYSELRQHLSSYLDSAAESGGEPIIVERKGKAPIALIDAGELSSLMELAHLLRSPANALRLFRALDEVKTGKGVQMSVEDFANGKWH